MIAVDTNILIYAYRTDSPHFHRASSRLRSLAEAPAAWAIPWPCMHEFLAIVTHPRVFVPPSPIEDALRQVEIWLESPSLTLLAEAEDYWRDLRALVISGRIAGPRIHDAKIAALCRQHGVHELWSADRDFSRFGGLKVVNPLLD